MRILMILAGLALVGVSVYGRTEAAETRLQEEISLIGHQFVMNEILIDDLESDIRRLEAQSDEDRHALMSIQAEKCLLRIRALRAKQELSVRLSLNARLAGAEDVNEICRALPLTLLNEGP